MNKDDIKTIEREIAAARVKLMIRHPFFGEMILRLKPKNVDWCKTICSDGVHFYYNAEFVASLNRQQITFCLAHEMMHAIFDHIGRRGSRNKGLWDMAIDYLVNDFIIHELGQRVKGADPVASAPEGILHDPKYHRDLTADEIYRMLEQDSVEIKMPLDEHVEASGGGSGEGESDGEGISVKVTGMGPTLTPDQIEAMRNAIKAQLLQTKQSVGAGNVPLGIAAYIDELLEPKIDWRAMLDAHIRSAFKTGYTYDRLSRRSTNDVILPSRKPQETVDVTVVIDTSGSMSDQMLRDILSETAGIMTTFRDFKLRVWTFDTQVYGYKEFTHRNLDEIYSYPMQGRGGTDFEVNWAFMKEQEIVPKRLIFFTDGYPCGGWGDPDYCDTLFVIHGTRSVVAPFGKTCYYEDHL